MTVTCTNVHYYDVDWETVNPKFGLEIRNERGDTWVLW